MTSNSDAAFRARRGISSVMFPRLESKNHQRKREAMVIRTNSERMLNCLGTHRVHFDVAALRAIGTAYRKLAC